MLKRITEQRRKEIGLITVQDNTMLKPAVGVLHAFLRLITVQDNTMLKPKLRV